MDQVLGEHEWQLIQAINTKLDKLCVDVAAQSAEQKTLCKAQCKIVADMQADVYGNGKRGMKNDVAYLMEKNEQAKNIVSAVIALIVSNVGTLAAWVWNNI